MITIHRTWRFESPVPEAEKLELCQEIWEGMRDYVLPAIARVRASLKSGRTTAFQSFKSSPPDERIHVLCIVIGGRRHLE
jgi:hypothetical protein